MKAWQVGTVLILLVASCVIGRTSTSAANDIYHLAASSNEAGGGEIAYIR